MGEWDGGQWVMIGVDIVNKLIFKSVDEQQAR